MTFRAADVLFLLPRRPDTIRIIGNGFDDLAAAAAASGIAVVHDDTAADVVVCRSRDARRALASRDHTVIVWGLLKPWAPRRFDRGARRFHAWGPRAATRVFIPTDSRSVGRRLVRQLSHDTLRARARNLALRASVEAGVSVPSMIVTVCAREPAPPALLTTDACSRVIVDPRHFRLDCGDGDDLQRVVFHLHERSGPRAVLKFSRVPDNPEPFARDEAGLCIVAGCRESVARHAPRFLGRGTLGRTAFSIESNAPGPPLSNLLARHPIPSWVPGQIGAITEWIEALHLDTASPTTGAPSIDASFTDAQSSPLLRERLDIALGRVPRVFAHGDPGSWNILSTRQTFTLVDWEGAVHASPPFWDLWYFLADALARLEAPTDVAARIAFSLDLFAGRTARSIEVFAATERIRAQLRVHLDDVGPLLAGCWIFHEARRQARARSTVSLGNKPATFDHLSRLAERWLDDPDLGIDWAAYRRFAASPRQGVGR